MTAIGSLGEHELNPPQFKDEDPGRSVRGQSQLFPETDKELCHRDTQFLYISFAFVTVIMLTLS